MTDVMGEAFRLVLQAVDILVTILVVTVIALIALRWVLLKVNPFGWAAFQVRRVTDPIVEPIAFALPMPYGAGFASLLVVLITLLIAYFFKEMTVELLMSLEGVIRGVMEASPVVTLGWLLYGTVSVLLLLIVLRIVMSWIPFARDSKWMWLLYSLTEPIMAPFRNLIPPLGMFDLSPILLMFLLSFVKTAILGLLIR